MALREYQSFPREWAVKRNEDLVRTDISIYRKKEAKGRRMCFKMGLHRAGGREGIGKKSTRNLHLTSSKENWVKVEVPGSSPEENTHGF